MQRTPVGNVIARLLLCAIVMGAVGCSSSWPKPINVSLDKGLAQEPDGAPSVTVHLVGVGKGEVKQYKTMSVTDYWAPGGASRGQVAARKSVPLGPGAASKTVARNDPVWKQWNPKVTPYLVVLADLRGVAPKGDDDPRRVVLPLNKKRWPGRTKEIRIKVLRDRLQVLTPPKPAG